jgi:hypothetical protein
VAAIAVGLRGAVLRVLFFGVLAIGVLSMHTIGHSSEHEGWVPASAVGPGPAAAGAAAPDLAGPAPLAQPPADGSDGCDGVACTGSPARAGDDGGYPLGGNRFAVICLAVVVGVAIAALLAAGLARDRRARAPAGSPGPAGTRQSGQGRTPGFPLRVVEIAVLRT